MRTKYRLLVPFLAFVAAPAFAQEPPPSPASTAAGEETPAATPRVRREAAPPAAPEAAVPPKPPKAPKPPAPPAAPVPSESEIGRREKGIVDDLKDEISYRMSRARRRFERGPVADAQKAEILAAIDRGQAQIETQFARVEKARVGESNAAQVAMFHGEISALAGVAHSAASQIEAVRTHDDDTEDTLQATSDEVDKIGDRAEEVSDRLDQLEEELADKAAEPEGEEPEGVGVIKGKHGKVHIGAHTEDQRVEFGGGVEVKKGEKVDSAVAFGGPVEIAGDVMGDAVAFGGNLHVTETGHVHGDAASFGGRIILDDGGRIDGEKTQVGAGKMAAGLLKGSHGGGIEPERHLSLPLRVGFSFIRAGAAFLGFFLLGMLVLLLAPERVLVVADGLEKHPFKSGLAGFALWLSTVPLTALFALLIIVLVGLVLLPLFWAALIAASFFGYVALAVAIGRRLPTGVLPTNNAFFALGAAILVVLWMIPYIGWAITGLLGMFALGAVVITRFGSEQPPSTPTSKKDDEGGSTLEAASA